MFALRFKGSIEIPSAGDWTFFLTSDDGSRLYLDGALAVSPGRLGHAGPPPGETASRSTRQIAATADRALDPAPDAIGG